MTVIKTILFDSPLLFFRGIRHASRSLDGKGKEFLSSMERNTSSSTATGILSGAFKEDAYVAGSMNTSLTNLEEMKLQHQILKEYSTTYNLRSPLQENKEGSQSSSASVGKEKEGIDNEVKSIVESFRSMIQNEQDLRKEKEASFFNFLASSSESSSSSSSDDITNDKLLENNIMKSPAATSTTSSSPILKAPSSSIRDKYIGKLQEKKKWALSKNKKVNEYQSNKNNNNSTNWTTNFVEGSGSEALEPTRNEVPASTIRMLAYIQSRKLRLYFAYENTEHNKLHLDNLFLGRTSTANVSSIFFPFLESRTSTSFDNFNDSSVSNDKYTIMKKKHLEKQHYFPYEKDDFESTDFGKEVLKRTKSPSPSSIMVVSNNIKLLEKSKENGFFTVQVSLKKEETNANELSEEKKKRKTSQFVYKIHHIEELQECIEELNGISYTSRL